MTLDFVVPNTATPGRTGAVSFFVCGTGPGQTTKWQAIAYDKTGGALQSIDGAADAPVVFTRAQGDISRVVFTPSAVSQVGGVPVSGYESIDTLRFNNPVAA